MSAVLTKKPGADYATQLTFPAVFAEQAKASNVVSRYYPVVDGNRVELMKGSGLQYDYHEQKRLDAHRRCLNGVKDNKASMARYLNSHANYVLPKPVLSQRVYANPSNGNQADIYSNRPVVGFSGGDMYSSLRGGVRTEEGQKWAMNKLKERIPQLDAIKAAKEAFLTGMPMSAQESSMQEISDITAKVELYGLFQRVESDVEQGVVNDKTMKASQSILKLLFSFAPYAIVRELEELTQKTEYLANALNTIVEESDGGVAQSVAGRAILKNAEYLSGIYEKMNEYLKRMNGVVGRPRKEREKLSSIFIKSLGFAGLLRNLPLLSARVREQIRQAEVANPNANPEGDDDDDDDDDEGKDEKDEKDNKDDDDDDDGKDERTFAEKASDAFRESRGNKEPKFDKENRQALGYNSGAFLGEAFVDDTGKAALPAPRSNMKSAEMSVEEVKQEAPSFESNLFKTPTYDKGDDEFDITDEDQRESRLAMLESELEPLQKLKESGEKYDKALFRRLAEEYNAIVEFGDEMEAAIEKQKKEKAEKEAKEKAAKEAASSEKKYPIGARVYNQQDVDNDALEKEIMSMFDEADKEDEEEKKESKTSKESLSEPASSAIRPDRTAKLIKASVSKQKRLSEKIERITKIYLAKEKKQKENPTDKLAIEMEELEDAYVRTQYELEETKDATSKLITGLQKEVLKISKDYKVKVAKEKSKEAVSRVKEDSEAYENILKNISELPPWIKEDSFSSPDKRREFMENAIQYGYYKPTKATEGNVEARVKGAMKSLGNEVVRLYKAKQKYEGRNKK